jgi:hypothetical protein
MRPRMTRDSYRYVYVKLSKIIISADDNSDTFTCDDSSLSIITDYIQAQFDFFYVDENSAINGLNYNRNSPEYGFWKNQIGEAGISTRQGSHLAVYWPWLLFQDYSGYVIPVSFLRQGNLRHPPEKPLGGNWKNAFLGLTKKKAMDKSHLAIVPLSTRYRLVEHSMWTMVFQNETGHLEFCTNSAFAEYGGSYNDEEELNKRRLEFVHYLDGGMVHFLHSPWTLMLTCCYRISFDTFVRQSSICSFFHWTQSRPGRRRSQRDHSTSRPKQRHRTNTNNR